MSRENVIRFITDLPKSPKDMEERFRKIPLSHKFFGVVTTAALTACSVGEKIGFVYPTSEGTKITPTEISPTAETGLGMNINEIPVTQESFGGTLLKGEITDVNPTDVATDTLKNKILAEFQASSFNPHSDLLTDPKIYGVDVLGSNLIDQSGNKQPFFFVRPYAKDGKPTTFDITDPSGVTYPAPFLFYTESDGKQFVPGGTGKKELGGRFLPVASYDAGEFRYFGLVSSVSDGNINLNLFMTYDSKTGITTYTDPYSRQTTFWKEEPSGSSNDISFSKLASLISYRSIPEPIATSTLTPEIVKPAIDAGLSAQNNASMVLENGTWVTKNPDGLVTATWDAVKGEWTYNMENIKMQIGIAEANHIKGMLTSLREGIIVNVPNEMLQSLDPSQQDPNPLVPAGYYGDFEQTTQKGVATKAEIGVDYRGIILVDEHSYQGTDEYVIVFTIQYNDHPDVMNVLLVPINNIGNGSLYIDLFPEGSTDPGTKQPGPMWDDFITILKQKNPIGRRMSIFVYVSNTMGQETLRYSPDHQKIVDAIKQGRPIPANLDIRLQPEDIRMPHDLDNP